MKKLYEYYKIILRQLYTEKEVFIDESDYVVVRSYKFYFKNYKSLENIIIAIEKKARQVI